MLHVFFFGGSCQYLVGSIIRYYYLIVDNASNKCSMIGAQESLWQENWAKYNVIYNRRAFIRYVANLINNLCS